MFHLLHRSPCRGRRCRNEQDIIADLYAASTVSGPDSGANPSSDSRANPSADSRANPSTDSGPDSGANPSADSGPNPSADSGPDSGPNPSADSGPDSRTDSGDATSDDAVPHADRRNSSSCHPSSSIDTASCDSSYALRPSSYALRPSSYA